ncbi:hypothetical protein [Sediminitomix flava]|uniref:SH3 domain-containing protein n=1 Tax=Sediminitomix flava TaxID=379075 RepID=A0A315Z7H2_SEDFL|nr:hypothetical protein [Sediminitomix flava]PWJ38551.1 hypothetical protein BC781_107141 [Sediminitomix flava]
MKALLVIFFCILFHQSFAQQTYSISIGKKTKSELLQKIKPNWLVQEGQMSLEKYYSYFNPYYFNSDTLVDFIYEGPGGGESDIVSIWINTGLGFENIISSAGCIEKIEKKFPYSPTEIHFIQYGCCADPHNFYQIWTYINYEIIEGIEYNFLDATEIPKDFNYKFSIRVKNTPYKLRATPEIINDNLHSDYDQGNVIAEYSQGDIGHVLDSKKDDTGRQWYFVLMENPLSEEGYHSYNSLRNRKWLGWMSGRYVEIINNSR